jgi:hypothetical protein
MARCVTCGTELHPERAQKYDYCMAAECQEKNAKGLTMVAIGINKAAEAFLILDESTREDLASGKYRDQRRGSFGPPVPATPRRAGDAAAPLARKARPARNPRPARTPGPVGTPGPSGRSQEHAPARKPWSQKQERLALLYNEQGLRPDEIAAKLGISSHLATQIVLAARNRGKS